MANELELKLAITPDAMARLHQHPLLVRYTEVREPLQVIHNRYFDTPNRDLAQHHVAVRLRAIGDRWWQTVKLMQEHPSGLSIRDEWELSVTGPALVLDAFSSLPEELKALLTRWAPQLTPVCETLFERDLYRVRFKKDCTFELAMDRGDVRAIRGKEYCSQAISELELELTSGDIRDLLDFSARLAADTAVIPDPRSKLSRGLALADRVPDRAVRVLLPACAPDYKAGMALAACLSACQQVLLKNALRLIQKGRDADRVERVHQMRVALRRLRIIVHQAQRLMPRRAAALLKSLGDLGHLLGAVRDWDVLMTHTQSYVSTCLKMPLDAGLIRHWTRIRKQSLSQLKTELTSPHFGQLMIELEGFRVRLSQKKGGAWGKWARRDLKKIYGHFLGQLNALQGADQAACHQARLICKRLRYSLDMYRQLLDPEVFNRWHDEVSRLQEQLGRLQDASFAAAQCAPSTTPEHEAIQAALYRLEQSIQLELERSVAAVQRLPVPWSVC